MVQADSSAYDAQRLCAAAFFERLRKTHKGPNLSPPDSLYSSEVATTWDRGIPTGAPLWDDAFNWKFTKPAGVPESRLPGSHIERTPDLDSDDIDRTSTPDLYDDIEDLVAAAESQVIESHQPPLESQVGVTDPASADGPYLLGSQILEIFDNNQPQEIESFRIKLSLYKAYVPFQRNTWDLKWEVLLMTDSTPSSWPVLGKATFEDYHGIGTDVLRLDQIPLGEIMHTYARENGRVWALQMISKSLELQGAVVDGGYSHWLTDNDAQFRVSDDNSMLLDYARYIYISQGPEDDQYEKLYDCPNDPADWEEWRKQQSCLKDN